MHIYFHVPKCIKILHHRCRIISRSRRVGQGRAAVATMLLASAIGTLEELIIVHTT